MRHTHSQVPLTVTVAQVRAATAALGIDFRNLHQLLLDGRRGAASHVRTNPAGRFVAAGDEIAMTTSSFQIREPRREEKRAAARDRIRRARWTR